MNRHLHSPTQLTEFAREFEEPPDTLFGKFVNRLTNVYNNSYNSVNEPGKGFSVQTGAGLEVPIDTSSEGPLRVTENVDNCPPEDFAAHPIISPVAESVRSSLSTSTVSGNVSNEEASLSSIDKVN